MAGASDKTCACPICGGRARWSLMKTGRVCITHDGCCQTFTRSDNGDEDARANFIAGNAWEGRTERDERDVRNVRAPEAGEPVTYVPDGEGFSVWAK